jgi:hypothetical protein
MDILISFSIVLLGVGLCMFGYIRWKGKMHWSYVAYGFWREANYLAIPLGTSTIIVGITTLPIWSVSVQLVLVYAAIFVMVLGFLVAWRIFKPDWVKWIEQNHKEIIPHIMVEIRDYGWHVETQEELEEWIAEIRRKYRV